MQQPLALITALHRLTRAKAAVRRLRPVLTAFFWLCAVFTRLCRVYTDASSLLSPMEGLMQILVAQYLHKCCAIYSMTQWNCADRDYTAWARGT